MLAFEYPNPFPPQEGTIFFQNAGNRISENTFSGNGTAGGYFTGDVALEGGLFGQQMSTNDCVSGNSFHRRHVSRKNRRRLGLSEQNDAEPRRR